MLGNRKAGFGGGSDTTLVSRDTVVVGDIHFGGALDIEGTVQGNIIAKPGTDAVVRVIDKGCVEGEIRVPEVIINGRVVGNVYSSKHLELAAKACVQGDVFYTLVEMAVGSEVNGSLQHVVETSGEATQNPDKAIPIAEAKQGKNRSR
ncbi:MAG: polymer-forming cytoskeletal protein [Halioglobus sp.]